LPFGSHAANAWPRATRPSSFLYVRLLKTSQKVWQAGDMPGFLNSIFSELLPR
jgi:hypothetical protein